MVEEVVCVKYKCGICGVTFDDHQTAMKCEETGVIKLKIRDLYGEEVDSWRINDYIYDLSMARLYRIIDSVTDGHIFRPIIRNANNDTAPLYPTSNYVLIHKGIYVKLKANMDAFGDY